MSRDTRQVARERLEEMGFEEDTTPKQPYCECCIDTHECSGLCRSKENMKIPDLRDLKFNRDGYALVQGLCPSLVLRPKAPEHKSARQRRKAVRQRLEARRQAREQQEE